MWSMLNECKSFLQTISWTNEICLSHELTNLVSLTNNQDVMAEINTRLKLWWQSRSLASISLLPNESATLGPCWSKQQKSRSWLIIYPKSSGYLESHYRLQVPAHRGQIKLHGQFGRKFSFSKHCCKGRWMPVTLKLLAQKHELKRSRELFRISIGC